MKYQPAQGSEKRMEEMSKQKPNGAAVGMTLEPPPLDEEEVRLTAYFLWEQEGRPEGREEHYWWAALEKIARQKSSDALLRSSGTDA